MLIVVVRFVSIFGKSPIAGVSSFQVQIADFDILTPGDNPDVLVAMNPAALKAHLDDLAPNGMLILNEDAFEEKNIQKAGYKVDPRTSGELDSYRVFEVPMEKLTKEALEDSEITGRVAKSFPNNADVSVNLVPTSCIPSPESPANLIVTAGIDSTVLFSSEGSLLSIIYILMFFHLI